jgi:hypothetical protein
MREPMGNIPDFVPRDQYPYRVLPDGVYPCDEAELRQVFVVGFEDSKSRGIICEGFLNLRDEVMKLGVSATQWVDGSFVETKLEPGDVDVVSFSDYDALNGLVASAQQAIVQLVNGGEVTRAAFRAHTFLVPSCLPGHPYHLVFEEYRSYWRNWFGKTREIPNPPGPDLPGHPKGFLQMTLGVAAPTVETGRSAP